MEESFDKLPQVANQILKKLEELERRLSSQSNYPQPEPDQFLTIQQAGAFLHLSVPTLYAYVHRGEIPVCKRGKRLLFSRESLSTWIMSSQKKTNSEIDAEVHTYFPERKRKSSNK